MATRGGDGRVGVIVWAEARYLSMCDMRWHADGDSVEVAVNRTKNDQEGYKRTSDLVWGEK